MYPAGFVQNLFFTEKAFAGSAIGPALLDQFIGGDDGVGFVRILYAADKFKPGFHAHGVHVHFFGVKGIDHVYAALVVGAREPARAVFVAGEVFCEQGAVQPREGGTVAFHTEKEDVYVADKGVNVFIKPFFNVAGVRGKQHPKPVILYEVAGFALDVEVAVLAYKRDAGDGAFFKVDFLHVSQFDDLLKADVLKHPLEVGILKRPGGRPRNDDVPDFMS